MFEATGGSQLANIPVDFRDGWTFAVFFEPRDALRLGLEVSNLEADRPAAADVGFDPDTDSFSVQLELRYYFGW